MRARNSISFLLVLSVWNFCYCKTAQKTETQSLSLRVSAADKNVQYEGRISQENGFARLYWSGTSATIRFRGKMLRAVMQDFNGQNHFNIVVDNQKITRIRIDSLKRTYTLAEGLSDEAHTVSIIKITQINKDYKRGYTDFFGFEIDNGSLMQPPKLPSRKIEFYGNSITCGHAILDSTGGDRGASIFEDNYQSYAAITARHFNARYRCIAKSGIGVSVSFGDIIMPEMYNRTNPFDSLSVWDFNEYTPDIVVINLLQNDQAILGRPEYIQYQRRFGTTTPTKELVMKAYRTFLQTIRRTYPNTNIICVMGSMDITRGGSPWPALVREAVASLHDSKVYTNFFQYKGSPKHPLVKDHEAMAKSLVSFIDSHIKW